MKLLTIPIILFALFVSGCAQNLTSLPTSSAAFTCKDYSRQSQAQLAWIKAGRPNASRVDRDGDGKVCESLPKKRSSSPGKKKLDHSPARTASNSSCPLNDRGIAIVSINRRDTPYTADHWEDYMRGKKAYRLWTIARGVNNRGQSLRGIDTKPGQDRDEVPANLVGKLVTNPSAKVKDFKFTNFDHANADIRLIPLSDNRRQGSQMGRQLSGCADGTVFTAKFSGSYPDGFNTNENAGQVKTVGR